MRDTPPVIRERAKRLRREATEAERVLWRALSRLRPAFTRQYPIGNAIADLACRRARVVVEVDRGQHDPLNDAARTRAIEAAGWRVIRVWNNEVLANLEGVADAIVAAVAERLPVGETPEFVSSRAGRVRRARGGHDGEEEPTPAPPANAGGAT